MTPFAPLPTPIQGCSSRRFSGRKRVHPPGRRLDESGRPRTAARDKTRRPQSAGSWSSRRGPLVVELVVVL
ncbi:hypothetical protein B0H12DRAFT_1123260 [Mycena haematopus]|nr:hypothetical protein B0H12DRAFT_1123260 [Mycena haematopus]